VCPTMAGIVGTCTAAARTRRAVENRSARSIDNRAGDAAMRTETDDEGNAKRTCSLFRIRRLSVAVVLRVTSIDWNVCEY
jgi:hypothetical protein